MYLWKFVVNSQTGKDISDVAIRYKNQSTKLYKKQLIYFTLTINCSEMEAVKLPIVKSGKHIRVWKYLDKA